MSLVIGLFVFLVVAFIVIRATNGGSDHYQMKTAKIVNGRNERYDARNW